MRGSAVEDYYCETPFASVIHLSVRSPILRVGEKPLGNCYEWGRSPTKVARLAFITSLKKLGPVRNVVVEMDYFLGAVKRAKTE